VILDEMYRLNAVKEHKNKKGQKLEAYFDGSTITVSNGGTLLVVVPVHSAAEEPRGMVSMRGIESGKIAPVAPVAQPPDFYSFRPDLPLPRESASLALDLNLLIQAAKALGTTEIELTIPSKNAAGGVAALVVKPYDRGNKAVAYLAPYRVSPK